MTEINKFIKFTKYIALNAKKPRGFIAEAGDLGLIVGQGVYKEFLALNLQEAIIDKEVHDYLTKSPIEFQNLYWILILKNKYVLPFLDIISCGELV